MNRKSGLIKLAILIIIAMSLAATIFEVSVDKIDDNLVVPLFTGLIGQIIFMIIY